MFAVRGWRYLTLQKPSYVEFLLGEFFVLGFLVCFFGGVSFFVWVLEGFVLFWFFLFYFYFFSPLGVLSGLHLV